MLIKDIDLMRDDCCVTNNFQKFVSSLEKGLETVIYYGYVCDCGLSSNERKIFENHLKNSKSKYVGFCTCDENQEDLIDGLDGMTYFPINVIDEELDVDDFFWEFEEEIWKKDKDEIQKLLFRWCEPVTYLKGLVLNSNILAIDKISLYSRDLRFHAVEFVGLAVEIPERVVCRASSKEKSKRNVDSLEEYYERRLENLGVNLNNTNFINPDFLRNISIKFIGELDKQRLDDGKNIGSLRASWYVKNDDCKYSLHGTGGEIELGKFSDNPLMLVYKMKKYLKVLEKTRKSLGLE